MWRAALRVAMAVAIIVSGESLVSAESKSLDELPVDVFRWSTLWVSIPQEMHQVGRHEGPLAAMTWGPVKGTAALMGTATKEVWRAAKPDRRPGHYSPTRKGPSGLILRYEF